MASGSHRKSSKASLGSQGPQGVCPNGAYYSSGLSNPHFAAMASSQNLPAVLNDPRKGKQKDFFTRSWGEDFTEFKSIPSSPFVCQLPEQTFDKYLRKLRKHCPRHSTKVKSSVDSSKQTSPSRSSLVSSSSLASVPAIFLDPNFDLNDKDTFEKIFPFLLGEKNPSEANRSAHFSKKIETNGRLAQERLSHHLDEVEVKIADQVAQKSHHFFQIMTHHDALITQLSGLVKRVEKLRSCLQDTDKNVYQVGLDICRLRRRHENANLVLNLLTLMSSLHQTQPTIQVLLSGNEFSGALDLISTSRDILSVDLQGVTSFRHLSSQLLEIHAAIGKILLTDFQTYISAEIVRDAKHIRASVLAETIAEELGEAESEHLTSVIFGLLRQNSFTFLEVLENASTLAVKNTFRDVSDELLQRSRNEMALTTVAAEFARYATSHEWVDFFDVLIGSLMYLLRRIFSIHNVISEAVTKTVKANSSLAIPEQQLSTLKSTSRDVLINVCDQVVERSSKILAQRSKSVAAKHITTKELKDLGKLVDVLACETFNMTGKVCSGLQLSLQSQSLMYMQAFDEEKRQCLTALLEQEKWKKSEMDISRTLVKFEQLPHFLEIFSNEEVTNGAISSSDSDYIDPTEHQIQTNNNHKETQLATGDIRINGKTYSVFDSAHYFLAILAEYCDLCTTLPSVTVELGLRSAEIIKLYNSRLCQFILGGAALTVANLKTITIRNLALAKQSLHIIIEFIPHVRAHFENCYILKKAQLGMVKTTDFSSPSNAESKQLEALQRQFEQANKHLTDHVDELEKKILGVIENILQHHLANWTASSASLPSANFKALCKQLLKLHESVNDIWPTEETNRLLSSVHKLFIESVRYEIRQRKILDPESPQGRLLMSELTFYGQSLKRLNVIPEEKLQREALEKIWENL